MISQNSKAKRAEYNRQWRKRNPEKLKAYAKKYKRKYTDTARKQVKAWRLLNRERYLATRREARKKRNKKQLIAFIESVRIKKIKNTVDRVFAEKMVNYES